MKLQGKVAIVTGASTGIGKAIATGMAAEGAAVVIDYIGSPDLANAVVSTIRSKGSNAMACEADVSNPDQVNSLVAQTIKTMGRLDIFVNNAGMESKHPFTEYPFELWQKVIAVDLTGPFLCAQAAAKAMIQQGNGGRIINISSVHEDLPMPTNAPYCAAKGGLRMLMRTIAVELDSWFLPDTHATSYRREHVKSSIIAEAIDPDRRWLRYFHGPGLFELEGEDYAGVFRTEGAGPEVLPPYTELVRFDAGPRLSGEELRKATRASLLGHLGHRPHSDPFERFAAQLQRELPSLLDGDAEDYHAYAFATVRMVGAAFELAAAQADWLFGARGAGVSDPMRSIVEGSKVLSFRLARRRGFDPAPVLASLSDGWHSAMSALEGVLA